jgi:hypothetical protein
MTDEEYCNLILIDFLIQISQGVNSKDCKIRLTEEQMEAIVKEDE